MPNLRLLAVGLVACAACAAPGPVPDDPEEAFAALEQRLLEAPTLLSISHLEAEGVVTADLRAEHLLTAGGAGRIELEGTFEGRPVRLALAFDGERMTLTGPDGVRTLEQPGDLRGALLLGLTRMGWLHNAGMLSGGGLPDAADGSMREFARAVRVLGGEPLEVEGRERRALTFGVEVRGRLVGTAVLWLDLETGLPIERWQKVAFPEGEMRVVETYEVFQLSAQRP